MRGRSWLPAVVAAVGLFTIGAVVGRTTSGERFDRAAQDHFDAPDRPPRQATPPDAPPALGDRYPPTPSGAVRAATAYAVALDGPLLLDPVTRSAALDVVSAASARAELGERFDRLAHLLATRLDLGPHASTDPALVWRPVPAGWQLRDYGGDEAVAAVWGTGVLVFEGRQLDQPGWQTTEVNLRWERDNWRLIDFRTEDGPTPPSAGSEALVVTGRRINDFRNFLYLPVEPDGKSG